MVAHRLLGWVLLTVLGAVTPAFAGADDEVIAKEHFRIGLRYYDSERWELAVKEFLRAWELSRRPPLLFNIAKTYERLNDAGRATAFYRQYLKGQPAIEERAEIEASVLRLAKRVHLLTVRANPPGSEIRIDDERVGAAPLVDWPLTAGIHTIEARHDGYYPTVKEVDLAGGAASAVTLDPRRDAPAPTVAADPSRVATPQRPPDLQRSPSPTPAALGTAPPPSQPAAPPTLAPGPAFAPTTPPKAAEPAKNRAWVGAVIGVSVAVAAGLGITLGVLYGGPDHSAAARASCTSPGCLLVDHNGASP